MYRAKCCSISLRKRTSPSATPRKLPTGFVISAINDERFAGLVVRHYAAKGYGRRRICEELYRRGIDRELWDGALEELPEADSTLDRLLAAKLRGDTSETGLRRAQNYLLRRGYSWDDTRAAAERYLSGKDTP